MGKTKNNSGKPSKWAALVTYVIALVCLLAGLLFPLANTEGFVLENMLAYQLPDAITKLFGIQLGFGAPLTDYSSSLNLFGLFTFDIGAVLVLLYALVTVAALIGLIPVIASNRKSRTALKTASVIECLAIVPLLTLILMQMYAYAATGTFSYALLIAFGGTLLMLIVQAFVYKKGSGAIKFVLFLLSAIATVATVYNLATFIPALADALNGALAGGLYGGATEGAAAIAALLTGDFAAITGGEGAGVTAMILSIAALAAALLVVINLYLDIFGLGKRTRKFMLITNIVRYALEVVAVLLTFIMTFFVEGAKTLSVLLIALLVIAIVQLVINIIRTVIFGKHKKKAPRKTEVKNEEENAEEATDGEAAEEEGEKKLSRKKQKRLAKEEKKAAKAQAAEEKQAEKEEKKAAKEEAEEKAEPEVAAPAPQTVAHDNYVVYTGPTDSFINRLNNAERSEFINVFLERNVVSLPNIPQYVPGGKNEKFFSAVFIYFGKIRDYVSDGLLNKLYEQINMM